MSCGKTKEDRKSDLTNLLSADPCDNTVGTDNFFCEDKPAGNCTTSQTSQNITNGKVMPDALAADARAADARAVDARAEDARAADARSVDAHAADARAADARSADYSSTDYSSNYIYFRQFRFFSKMSQSRLHENHYFILKASK
jgi:hypothetical protein